MKDKLILARNGDFANLWVTQVPHDPIPDRQIGELPPIDEDQAWLVGPQIHQFLTAYGESARRILGVEFALQVTIADNLGPIRCDYLHLLIDILDECVGYFGWRENGSSFAQIRLSQVRHNRRLSHLLLEVRNRGPKGLFAQKLTEGLLRLRTRMEFWSGFIRIDSISYDETTIRAILPIVSSL